LSWINAKTACCGNNSAGRLACIVQSEYKAFVVVVHEWIEIRLLQGNKRVNRSLREGKVYKI
jgi:hypothetical protein